MDVGEPREGTRLFLLDGEGVLFSEAANELCHLSPLGVLVWQGLEGRRSAAAMADAAVAAFGLTANEAESAVHTTVAQLREHGLLAGSELPARSGPSGESAIDHRIPPFESPKAVASEHHYVLLGSRFRVRFAEREQERWAHPVFAHLERTDARPADVVIDVVASGGHHFLYLGGDRARLAPGVDALAPVLKEVLWSAAVNRYPYFLYLHAGVVGDGRRCLVLPAASGSGKSSLTAALCHRGFQYFSDEVALVEPRTFHVRAIPLSLCVKESGWPLLARYRPELSALATHQRADGKQVRYLPPHLSTLGGVDGSYPVSHLIFPRYDAAAATEIRPLPKVEALRRLMDDCLEIRARLDQDNVKGLVDWMSRLATYELPMSSLDEAADLVQDLVSS